MGALAGEGGGRQGKRTLTMGMRAESMTSVLLERPRRATSAAILCIVKLQGPCRGQALALLRQSRIHPSPSAPSTGDAKEHDVPVARGEDKPVRTRAKYFDAGVRVEVLHGVRDAHQRTIGVLLL